MTTEATKLGVEGTPWFFIQIGDDDAVRGAADSRSRSSRSGRFLTTRCRASLPA